MEIVAFAILHAYIKSLSWYKDTFTWSSIYSSHRLLSVSPNVVHQTYHCSLRVCSGHCHSKDCANRASAPALRCAAWERKWQAADCQLCSWWTVPWQGIPVICIYGIVCWNHLLLLCTYEQSLEWTSALILSCVVLVLVSRGSPNLISSGLPYYENHSCLQS